MTPDQLPDHPTVPAPARPRPRPEESVARCREFADEMAGRRTIRDFSTEEIPLEAVREAVRAAATAPSGANLQPWRFVVVTDAERKRLLRQGAEDEERTFYEARASEEWLAALAPLGTDWRKPFLEEAPVVIAVFEVHGSTETPKPYYAKESVGLAVGLLLAALHRAGFATLTHTPSPMKWINQVLERPAHERPFVLIPVGYPAPDARVPDITRKPLSEVLVEL
ncbi:nitroreductase family protein [Nocardioides coralli]|uniref:nitroreductase family protein n=1 Tax=Nocardioides coralli TaxID=2872154 RepID=UPI001CA3C5D5|nr:nitroreductase family protein [Nocardioides coralli]QZY29730.1 nitroreductase family protein [Nocardioides coralli]